MVIRMFTVQKEKEEQYLKDNPNTPQDRVMERARQVCDFRSKFMPRDFAPSAESHQSFEESVLDFSGNQPDCFYEEEGGTVYRGQDRAKERIDSYIQTMGEERVKFLLSGPAGTGKTALARIIAKRVQELREELGMPKGRYFEILPNQMESKADLDAFMHQIEDYDLIFIDEVHVLQKQVGVESLYHVLQDTGQPKYPLGDGKGWIDVPRNVSWIAATTEPGQLDRTTGGALRRRLEPEIRLDAPDVHTLAQILHDQGPIHSDAAYEIAYRSGGLPWQALLIHKDAANFAQLAEVDQILPPHAERAFEIMGLDENGLLPEDREVLKTLLGSPYTMASGEVRYKMSEAALCASAGIDKETYKQRVQPKLMQAGLMTTVGGQSLTTKALQQYGWLVQEE